MSDLIKCTESYSRGNVWYVDLGVGKVGSEQYGERPAVIVSNNFNNKYSTTITVVIATSKGDRKKELPVHVMASLENSSCFLCEQIITVSKERLTCHIGKLTRDKMTEINTAMLVQLGLHI